MLRKLFLLCGLLGLSFVICGPGLAGEYPAVDDINGPINIFTGLKKDVPFTPLDTANVYFGNVPLDGMPLSKPTDYCQDYNVRSSSSGYNGIWTFAGAGIGYFAYQDISIECPATGTQDVQSVRFLGFDYQDPGTITMHGELWTADLSDPSCPVPGSLVAVGREVTVDYPGGSGWMWIDCPLSWNVYDYNCIDGPFFACVRFTSDYTAPYFLVGSSDDLVEEDGLAPVLCKWYLEDPSDPGVYEDMGDGFDDAQARDWYIYSITTTDAQNDCNVPGICDWDWLHCVWETYSFYNFTTPSSSGQRDAIWQRWEAAAPCTILQIDLYSITVVAGDPGFRIAIYDDDNEYPGNELFYQEVASGALNPSGWNSFDFAAQQPVIVAGVYYVMCSRASWAGDGDTLTIPLDDAPECPLSPKCYTGVTMGAADPGNEIYVCDLYGAGLEFELFAEVYTCCAEPKVSPQCNTWPGNWPTHGHDYARTCFTDWYIGDPSGIALAWKSSTTRSDKRFSNTAVVGGKVYTSDDQAMHCFDLATGALQWTYFDPTGISTASSMRNTPTVTGGYVYGSGGTAQSFYKLDTLGALVWSRHYNSMGGGVSDWLCAAMRFGVSVVLDGKVIFGDDGGCLWALNDADGMNHSDWAANPIDLNGPIFHSPTYPGYGNYIYVATVAGDVYKVNYTNGSYTRIFSEPDAPDDGFPSGCSYDTREDMIYLASHGDVSPERFKIDTDGNVIWQFEQGNVLYAPPTIGKHKIYYGMDFDSTGVLIVNKYSGALEYNFAADGVGSVPQPVTLTCYDYLFASDRNGTWYLLDADYHRVVWSRHFQSPLVWGTALAYHDLEDKTYAVMSIWLDINTGFANGAVLAWDLDAPPRPMMEMLVDEVTVPVPLNSTFVPGGGHVDGAFTNWCWYENLNITEPILAYNVDPATAAQNAKPNITQGTSKIAETAETTADRLSGKGYLSFFDAQGKPTKRGLIAGMPTGDPEGLHLPESKINYERAKKRSSDLAAGTDLLRTTNIQMSVSNPISRDTEVDLTWDYDGTGLGRSVDHEFIELISDDPDYYPDCVGLGIYPGIDVYYVGSCPFENFEFMWFNGYEMWHKEVVFNYGRYGDGTSYGLDWGDGINNAPIYDGAFFLFQEGGTWVATWIYDFVDRRFLPDTAPISGECGVDYADFVPIGRSVVEDWHSGGGCPPVLGVDYLDLEADVSWTSFIDTLESENTSYGTKTTQVEISPYDFGHGYGDFKLRHFKIENRNDAVLENVLTGMIHDWDPQPNNECAMAIVPECGGIVMWDSTSPSIAFGHVVMPAYTSASNSGVVDGAETAYKMLWAVDNEWRVYSTTCSGGECSFDNDPNMIRFIDDYSGIGYDPSVTTNGDKCEALTFARFDLPALGEHHLYCAVIGVDATTNNRGAIEDEVRGIAYRANKLAGFARGDVNDDGEVNAIDVALIDALVNGAPVALFPWDGNGDVDLSGAVDVADATYLLNYLMGGPAPLGEWRFDFMP